MAQILLLSAFFLSLSTVTLANTLDVEVSGIKDELLKNVQLFLNIYAREGREVVEKTAVVGADDTQISEIELRRLHRLATSEIREALKPFGYYQVRIDSSLTKRAKRWLARYQINAGVPTRLQEVTIEVIGEGRDRPEFAEILASNTIHVGSEFVHSHYEAMKTALYDTAYQNGFIDAQWSVSEIKITPDRKFAMLKLVLDTRARHYFGEVLFDENSLDPTLLARFVPFDDGDPYDARKLLQLQFALDDSHYFRSVEINPRQDMVGTDYRIPISVKLKLQAPRQYNLSVGVATDTGPRLSVGAVFPAINSRGHRVRVDLRSSGIENALAARYEVPIANVTTDTVEYSTNLKRETVGDADTDQFGWRVSRNEKWLGFRRRVYGNLEHQQYRFKGDTERQSNLLISGINLLRESADDLRYPLRGYSLAFDVRAAGKGLLSDSSFLRTTVEARWVRGLSAKSRLIAHGELGALTASDFDDLSPTQRFFTGGDRSVRGYAYQEIGTQNHIGVVTGGSNLVLASLELEHLFYKDYGLALFVDTGDAFRSSLDMKTGAGIGFRWRSPIGMLRVDLAHPLDSDTSNFRIHISLGPDL